MIKGVTGKNDHPQEWNLGSLVCLISTITPWPIYYDIDELSGLQIISKDFIPYNWDLKQDLR